MPVTIGTCVWLLPGDTRKVVITMLWTIAVILFVLWILGLITGTTINGLVHALLVLAVIAVVIQLITGRRAV
ncbi:MAG: hypothetical protein CVT60_07655 [Actinobacteria bacterium HGW-Actinobacteria-10]|jgi:hypothetical protein|nr:MAG: hypothetical protein CVT60_07655 [Actinobacteria bacterium HGW-Actinobacteria-10]